MMVRIMRHHQFQDILESMVEKTGLSRKEAAWELQNLKDEAINQLKKKSSVDICMYGKTQPVLTLILKA